MGVLYILKITNPEADIETVFPPRLMSSSWHQNLKLTSIGAHAGPGGYVGESVPNGSRYRRQAYFKSVEEFESWINASRLTDPELLALFDEWKTAYNLTIEEEYYEIPNYTPNVSGIFG